MQADSTKCFSCSFCRWCPSLRRRSAPAAKNESGTRAADGIAQRRRLGRAPLLVERGRRAALAG
eukprot:9200791-Pyramimonas_sp.AAC.1